MIGLLRLCVVLCLVLVQPALADDDALSSRDRKLLSEAFQQIKKNDYRAALRAARRLDSPLAAKLVRWFDMTRRRPESDFDEVTAFLDENPHWPYQYSLRRAAEAAMPPHLPPASVIAWFADRPPLSAPGVTHLGTALLNAGKRSEAQALVREAWVEVDFTRVEEAAFRKRFMPLLKRQDFIDRLDRLLWDGRYKTARAQAIRLGKGYAYLTEARQALANRRPGVDGAIRRVPKSLRHDPGLAYERARWRLRKGLVPEAISLLGAGRETAQTVGRWWRLRHWAAREAIQAKHYDQAYRMASLHGHDSGGPFAEGEWLAGWISLSFLNKPKQAYRHFARLYEGVSTPISRARGAYWSGLAADVIGRHDWAQRWFEVAAEHGTTFYGQLASLKLKRPLSVDFTPAAAPSAAARARFAGDELARAVALLASIGEERRIDPFVYALTRAAGDAETFQLISDLARKAGREDLGLYAAKEARDAGFLLTDPLFPLPDGIEPGDDPERALVLAMMRQESAFDAEAVSPAGARGLMQLMPATAKREAGLLRVRYSKSLLTRDPDYNLRLGRSHLGRLIEEYGGSLVLALAAYNAGSSRVSEWIEANGDPRTRRVDSVQWIEEIPFSETRNYVQRVLESLAVYRVRLGVAGTPLPLEPATAELYNSKR